MFDYAYFYQKRTMAFVTRAKATYYDVELAPYGKKLSTIRVIGSYTLDNDLIVQIDRYLFLLDSCVPSVGEDTTTISLRPFYSLFDRDIPYVRAANTTVQIRNDLTTYFKNCTDPLFRFPWLQPMSDDTALPYITPEVDETGRYNMKNYIEQVAETIYLHYENVSGTVNITAERRRFLPEDTVAPSESTTLEFVPIYDTSITRDILISAAFSMDLISKITHYDPDTSVSTDYYLLTDGTVSTDVNAESRAEGRWIVYKAPNVNVGLIAAQFARSRYSHSIEVRTPITDEISAQAVARKNPAYYCKCRIKLPSGAVIDSRITSINVRSAENRAVTITAGQAITRLSEIIQEVRNARN